MRVYIDFDGVILDTDYTVLNRIKDKGITKKEYIMTCDMDALLNSSEVINNALDYLRDTKLDIYLLSKISTIEEGISKVKYLRDNKIKMNIHLVPANTSKSDIVDPLGNILIDDKVYNLDEWKSRGGMSIFFHKDNKDVDYYGKINTEYQKISDLSILINGEIG